MANSASSRGDANKDATSAKGDADKTDASPESTWGASQQAKEAWVSRHAKNPDRGDAATNVKSEKDS